MTSRPLPMPVFAAAALSPAALLGHGVWAGGGWLWAGVLYMAVLVIVLDQLIPYVAGNAPEGAEFPAADAVLVAVGLAGLALMPLTVWAITADHLRTGEKLLLAIGTGTFLGQVGHPAAHELIHRPGRWLYRLGVLVYGMMLLGHHASAHRLVHHRAVATPDDPNSARAEESFWRFAPRAWIGGFRAGKAAEDARRIRRAGRLGLHPYLWYLVIGLGSLGAAALIGGLPGMLIWLLLSAHAQLQQLLGDYVQHYGLSRARLPDGRYEPVSPRHSWNTPHWFSSALMLNAPRHSDHHAHPSRPYPALRLAEDAPLLPWPLPVACGMAMVPRLWRRRMRPHLKRWHTQTAQEPAQ
ncbi:MAG: alkane 1-monooxygenase [Pseudotabrizicola sp.]|uniref:alkane 1-monooxygenase n=1 Tax=Pseudotabrizicola sp. TaxID=2939647 RepID=UPI00271D3941|nr:alkane 1-monooxygenase [Pseudotabrizicola sp.]MDO9640521.1 alkane 1-monooxygenase [Pseudotabrizicola sp.]